MRIILIFFSLMYLFSCKNNNASGDEILSKKKMQAVLWDVIQADVYSNQIIKHDSTKNSAVENARLQQQIFTIHKITKTTFDKSYAYYQAHPDDMQAILDSLSVDRSRSEKLKLEREKYIKPVLKR